MREDMPLWSWLVGGVLAVVLVVMAAWTIGCESTTQESSGQTTTQQAEQVETSDADEAVAVSSANDPLAMRQALGARYNATRLWPQAQMLVQVDDQNQTENGESTSDQESTSWLLGIRSVSTSSATSHAPLVFDRMHLAMREMGYSVDLANNRLGKLMTDLTPLPLAIEFWRDYHKGLADWPVGTDVLFGNIIGSMQTVTADNAVLPTPEDPSLGHALNDRQHLVQVVMKPIRDRELVELLDTLGSIPRYRPVTQTIAAGDLELYRVEVTLLTRQRQHPTRYVIPGRTDRLLGNFQEIQRPSAEGDGQRNLGSSRVTTSGQVVWRATDTPRDIRLERMISVRLWEALLGE